MRTDHAAKLAQAILGFRRQRPQHFPADLFSEPAWDLLLELFLADAAGTRLTARDVAIRSGVTPQVMSRWLMHLSKIGMVLGDGDGDIDDLLTLSGEALSGMERLMDVAVMLRDSIQDADA